MTKKIDRILTDFCHFGQITVNLNIICQHFVTLDNFLSIICHLSHLDSYMFLSIRPLFPCSVHTWFRNRKSIISNRMRVFSTYYKKETGIEIRSVQVTPTYLECPRGILVEVRAM